MVRCAKADFGLTGISAKLKALLAIACKVQKGGKRLTAADVESARKTDSRPATLQIISSIWCTIDCEEEERGRTGAPSNCKPLLFEDSLCSINGRSTQPLPPFLSILIKQKVLDEEHPLLPTETKDLRILLHETISKTHSFRRPQRLRLPRPNPDHAHHFVPHARARRDAKRTVSHGSSCNCPSFGSFRAQSDTPL